MRENRLNRQPSGRGRSSKRTRTPEAAASTHPGSRTNPASTAPGATPAAPGRRVGALGRVASRIPRTHARLAFTRRALVLFAVLAVLAMSIAGSLRVWVVQGQDLAAARAQIEQRTARVAELEDELARWNDPAYVKAQARNRLGWVMPGEIGYRVIGADGEVLSGSTEIEGVGAPVTSELAPRWWDRAAASLHQADQPAPASGGETEQRPG